jgi:hypothetical protein
MEEGFDYGPWVFNVMEEHVKLVRAGIRVLTRVGAGDELVFN